MIEQLRELDKIDKEIIKYIQNNLNELSIPEDLIETLSERTSKSKEVIQSRLTKLQRMKLLDAQIGLNIQDIEIKIARIDIFAKKVNEVVTKLSKCPAITNILRMTGDYNISILMAAPTTAIIEKYIDTCLRSDLNIIKINTSYIVDSVNKFIVPVILDSESLEVDACFSNCGQKLFAEALKGMKKSAQLSTNK